MFLVLQVYLQTVNWYRELVMTQHELEMSVLKCSVEIEEVW